MLTGEQMSHQDRYTIDDLGVPGAWLMECAASAVRLSFQSFLKNTDQIAVVCGSGNNGGDGYAVARQLHIQGYNVSCFQSDQVKSQDAKMNRDIALKSGVPVKSIGCFSPDKFTWVVDALVGTGLNRPLKNDLIEVVKLVNEVKNIVSIDIPSGICSVTGQGWGCFIEASTTITFQYAKRGHYLKDGIRATGKLVIADIGIAPLDSDEQCWYRLLPSDPVAPCRLQDSSSHKGIQGRVTVVGSALGMVGAGLFCAKAAQNVGSGLVSIMAPEQSMIALQSQCPEIMVKPFGSPVIADALILGPGCSQQIQIKDELKNVLRSFKGKVVIDAEGLRIFEDWEELISIIGLNRICSDVLLTPHPGEMNALLKLYKEYGGGDLSDMLKELNEVGVAVLAKDAYSVLFFPEHQPVILGEPNANLARGGSGDVLAGIIGSFMAKGHTIYEACILAMNWFSSAASATNLILTDASFRASSPMHLILKSLSTLRLRLTNN